MRLARRILVVSAVVTLGVAAAPSSGAQTPTVTSVIGAADGLSADIDVEEGISPVAEDVGALDTLTLGPLPTVTLPPEGGSVTEQVLDLDEVVTGIVGIGLTADLLRTSAEGALGPDGFATAETTVANLAVTELIEELGAQQLGTFIEAEAVTATCAADLEGVSGSTTLVNATVLGQTLEEEPAPNTEIPIMIVGASASVTLNQQVENPDGSLSVTALVVDVSVSDVFSASLEIGPATCGVVEGLEVPAAPVVPVPVQVTPRFTG
ncbi:MAG TPA: choice-of-anchor P family protein [Acidimicrobiia bacterium]